VISPEDWRPADGLTLEPNALRSAKELTCCLALTAGPGAGKTEMLAQRADFLLRTGTCRYPKRILAISFKVDASKNLKDRVHGRCGRDLASRFDSYTFHAFAKRIIDRFRTHLSGNDSLVTEYTIGKHKVPGSQITFEELVPLAIQILRESRVARNAVRQTYSDVFLDEFQDCTDRQYELIQVAFLGAEIRLTAVGDTKQKIMGWAGALEGIFGTFADDFAAVPLNMYRNFRSKPKLLRLQNEIIRNLDANSVMADEQIVDDEGEVFAWHFPSSLDEASYLASLIDQWITNEEVPPSEIAILVSKQLDLYADHLMLELQSRSIPYRNEQQLQDITVEPIARLIVDYLSCLYGQQQPKAWVRLLNQMMPFSSDEGQTSQTFDLHRFISEQKKIIATEKSSEDQYSGWWETVRALLNTIGLETLSALSPEYESKTRLKEVVKDTRARIKELLDLENDLPLALTRFVDDQAVRILTIHKSKGLEFDSVIIMAVENEIFFGDKDANRCAYFVGVSRAKRRLVLTHVDSRPRPEGYHKRWDEKRSVQAEYIGYALPFIESDN